MSFPSPRRASGGAAEVLVVALGPGPPPEDVVAAFAADERPFALLGAWAGGGALLGSEPMVVAPAGGVGGPRRHAERRQAPSGVAADVDPFDVLDSVPLRPPGTPGAPGGGDAVGGGWFGYLGHQCAAHVEALPAPGPRPVPVAPFALGFYDHVLRYRSPEGQWYFEALVTPQRAATLEGRIELFRERLRITGGRTPCAAPQGVHLPGCGTFECGPFDVLPGRDEHEDAVRRALDYIAAGDVYQVNLCVRLEAAFAGDPAGLFAAAVRRLRPPYAAFVGTPGVAVASLSPELFLATVGRRVRTSPIKGTIPRPGDAPAAVAARRALEANPKDRAENVMIVDLMRNDLGRVCDFGTVRVPALYRVEAHPGVWHLVSDVVGELREDAGPGTLLRACFPPGSVTGAPKVRATEILTELEAAAREVGMGAVGYASPIGRQEWNVAIRTFEMAAGRIWLSVGGGIVADSDPAGEYRECGAKARPLLEAIVADAAGL